MFKWEQNMRRSYLIMKQIDDRYCAVISSNKKIINKYLFLEVGDMIDFDWAIDIARKNTNVTLIDKFGKLISFSSL